MISVIICSVNPGMLAKIKKNIEATIGSDFELIIIDNRLQQEGICKVYNKAAASARFNILCFIHEDVFIHSENWGARLSSLLSDSTIGLVGVSGAVYKSAFPSAWPACDTALYRNNTIQHFNNLDMPVKSVINPLQVAFDKVSVLDGVFLATTKSIFNLFLFDENNFTGFHCYDLDLSLNIGKDYELVVTYDILLEHFSEGNFNRSWFDDSIRLHKKWKNILPKQTGAVTALQKRVSEFIACSSFLQHALSLSDSKKMILQHYLRLLLFYGKYNGFNYTKTVFKKLLNFSN